MALKFSRERGFELVRSKAEGDVTFTPALVEVLSLFDGTSASYGTVYRKLAPVRTVVDFLADNVSTTPLKFYRRRENGRPEERNHRLAQLLRRPNPGLTERRLVWGTVADVAVYGRAYWRFVPGLRGRPDALIPLPPYRVTPKGGDLVQPASYDFWSPNGTGPVTYSADEIVDIHLYDPEDRRIGASKLAALKNILQEEVEASRNRTGFWSNAARIGGYMYFPETFTATPDQLETLRESVQSRHSGSQNAGKVGIIPYGGKFDPDGFSPKDSEFVQGRQFVLEATARVFNIPLPLLSLTEQATYASQREFHKALYVDVLPPWFELIQSEIELQLFPWFTDTQDLYPEFVVESKLRGDFIDQASVLNTAIGRPWMTVREGRNVSNFDDRGEPSDDELVVPVGPNYALESLAGMGTAAPPALAVVASMPTYDLRHKLVSFFDRQERSVTAKMGAGEAFDRVRWDRELGELIGDERAERVNLDTMLALVSDEPRDVFEQARTVRAPRIAALASQEVAG